MQTNVWLCRQRPTFLSRPTTDISIHYYSIEHDCIVGHNFSCRPTSSSSESDISENSVVGLTVGMSPIYHCLHELKLHSVYWPAMLFSVVARRRTMLEPVPLSRVCQKMWGSRWNFDDISFRSWVITTSGLLAAIAIFGCRRLSPDVGQYRK